MELLLIRHALPIRVENEEGEPADPPLSEVGRHQAQRLASWLAHEHLDALYASPLRRAHETAVPLAEAKGLELILEPGVREFDRDAHFYIPLEELKEQEPERWRELVESWAVDFAALAEFQKEAVGAVERIIRANPGKRVAVVCHGGVINAWAGHLLGVQQPMFFNPFYTSINRFLAASSGERSLESLNETAHLVAER